MFQIHIYIRALMKSSTSIRYIQQSFVIVFSGTIASRVVSEFCKHLVIFSIMLALLM